jgi:hypothetical protein
MEVKNIESVTKEVFKRFLIDSVFPDIKAKWPIKHTSIVVQLDNARPHCSVDDPEIVSAGTSDGWNIRLSFQPAKSPDFNVLDLGFFASIQALQYKETVRNAAELINAVESSFQSLSQVTLENTFLTQQLVWGSAIAHFGSNQFKPLHVGKEKMRRRKLLPENYSCDGEIYAQGVETLCMMKQDKQFRKPQKQKKKKANKSKKSSA